MSRANPSLSRVLSVAGLLLATPLAVAGPLQTVTRVGVHSREARSEVDLAPRDVIDFERHTPAGLVTETLSLFGDGPILIRGARRDLDAGNAALVIDSADPGQATDLGTPGSSFGGYGIGSASEELFGPRLLAFGLCKGIGPKLSPGAATDLNKGDDFQDDEGPEHAPDPAGR